MRVCAGAALLLLFLLPAYGQDEPTPLNVFHGEIPGGERVLYVAPDGDNENPGTEEQPWAGLDFAVSQVEPGDVIVMRGGVYHHAIIVRIDSPSGTSNERIVVTAYPGEVPILDFSSQPDARNIHGIRLNADGWHLIGLTLRYASHNGIRVDGNDNILEQITAYGNFDTGIHMAGGASHNLVLNSDSFQNCNCVIRPGNDNVGENADGFSAKFEIGPGNRFIGCRAWENSDDGWDFWEAEGVIVVDSSWAFGNGDPEPFGNPEGFDGNGNGFKLGGNFVEAAHIITRSMAFDNFGVSGNAKGFDYNNNRGAMRVIHNTAYNNGRNFVFQVPPSVGQTVFLNNLSAASNVHAQTPAGAVLAGNSWQYETEITDEMFLSVDTELAKLPREMDGSLPDVELLKPVPGSFPVDAGVAIGEPFYGAAPDMGAREQEIGAPVEAWIDRGSGDLVTDLRVYDLDFADGWTITNQLDIGSDPYGYEEFTITSIPGEVSVDEWIRTPAESGAKNYLFTTADFHVVQPRHLLVAHSDEIVAKPQWLAGFAETESKVVLADAGGVERLLTVYRREVDAGELIELGRNSTDGTLEAPMYLVMIGNMTSVSAEDEPEPRVASALNGVYPNPVGESATVTFSLARSSFVWVAVYDALGREVASLARGFRPAGVHGILWEARNAPSGIYFVRLVAGGHSEVRALVRAR